MKGKNNLMFIFAKPDYRNPDQRPVINVKFFVYLIMNKTVKLRLLCITV